VDRTRRTLLKLLGSSLSLGVLAACAAAPEAPRPTDAPARSAPTAPPPSAAQPTAPPKPTEPAKPTLAPAAAPAAPPSGTLVFWLYKTRLEPLDRWRTERIQAWGKQAGVNVDVIEIATSDYNKKIPAAIESKTLPDVLEASDEWALLLQPRGLLADQTEVFQRIDREQKWAPAVKALSTWPDGKVYQVSIGTSGDLLISRDDLLKEAGLTPPPKTWVELFDWGARVQRPPRTYGVGEALSNTGDGNHWVKVLQSYGVRIADDQGKQATFGNYRAEALEAIELIVDGYDNKKVFPPGVLTWDQTGDNDAFQSGRTIFAFNPLSIPTWLRDKKPDLLEKTGTYLLPAGPKHLVQSVGSVAMSVRSDSRFRDRASDLIYFLYDREYYREFFNRAQYGPTTEAHYAYPAFDQHWLKSRVDLAKSGKPSGWPDVYNEAYAETQTAFHVPRMLQRIVVDRWTPERAFEEAADAYQKVYQKYART
jgi:multiple sugar transport system substrate-binding protein